MEIFAKVCYTELKSVIGVVCMDVKSIISQMTLEEKAALCSGKDFWHLDTPQRLGIESVMVSDVPIGIRKQSDAADHLGLNASVPATSYPTGSCMACSFDRELFRRSGEVLGHACQAEDLSVLLGPAINIKRSPLGGRNFEYLSEDPYLTGELAKNYINGVQSQNVGVSVKHFAANSQEYNRMSSDSVVDERTLREIYLSAFETAVKDSKPWTIMCSYNRINGTFAAENKRLLTDILRDELNLKNLSFTDKVDDFVTYQFKPQLKTVGPKFGKQLNEIRAALTELDGTAAKKELDENGKIVLSLPSGEVTLETEDLLIEAKQKDGFYTVSDRGITVAIDTTLTKELIEEGFVRELISKIQTMRKEAGFNVTDHISVTVNGSEKVVDIALSKKADIAGDTLADGIAVAEPKGYTKEWDINGEKVTIGVEKV